MEIGPGGGICMLKSFMLKKYGDNNRWAYLVDNKLLNQPKIELIEWKLSNPSLGELMFSSIFAT